MKVLGAVLLILMFVMSGCWGFGEPQEPTPDMGAEVRTAVAEALPTPLPDIDATVEARMAATLAAMAPTTAPAPTSTSQPTATPTSLPAPTPIPIPTPTPLPTPTQVATRVPVGELSARYGWTAEEPATKYEIELALGDFRGNSITISSWGGAWQSAQRQAFFLPFTDSFGIEIVEDSPVYLNRIKTMVETDNVAWDVMDFSIRWVYTVGNSGLLEELDPAIHNGYLEGFPEGTVTPWSGGAGTLWSTGLAYSLDAYPNHEGAPKSWADFWDVEKVLGNRSLKDRPDENVIFAQMGLYPEKLERAEGKESIASLDNLQVEESFAHLRIIKDHLVDWWSTGTDCPFKLISGEYDTCSAWNARLWDKQTEDPNSPLYYCYECGHVNQTGVYSIPRGSRNKDLAELYMAWIGQPENAARVSKYIPYGPLNGDAAIQAQTVVKPTIADILPTSPIANKAGVLMDEQWLSENMDEGQMLRKRFHALLQE